jgi:membrane-bound serine protease (ClpP class)
VRIDSVIHPVAAEVLKEAIDRADTLGATSLVVELNTPGGDYSTTRKMSQDILGAKTPVVIFVSPPGAQAASAGFFLLLSADLAAMAPGTNTGAAHPVGGQGEDIEGTLGEKAEQDAAAWIRSLAARRGRDQKIAEEGVVNSRSFSAEEALELGLADVIAPHFESLLESISERKLEKGGTERTLLTRSAPVVEVEMTTFQRIRSTLAHPNIAYLLLTLGGIGIYFELANPGSILPGVVGAICLILAFYALAVLPINYAGLALMALAALLFIAELFVHSMGLLTAGGVLSLVLGSLMLFRDADPAIRVSNGLIAGVATVVLVIVTLLVSLVVRTHRGQVSTGGEGLVMVRGTARSALGPRGKVSVRGEIWNAVADEPIAAGENVEVVSVDGMTLRVRPAKS